MSLEILTIQVRIAPILTRSSTAFQFTALDKICSSLFRFDDSIQTALTCMGWVNTFTSFFLANHRFREQLDGTKSGTLCLYIYRTLEEDDEDIIRSEVRK